MAYDDDDVGSVRPERPRRSERLANEAFGAVALGRVTHASGCGDPDARAFRFVRAQQEEDEAGRHDSPPGLLYASKIRPLFDSVPFGEPTLEPELAHASYFLVAAVTARRHRPRRRRLARTARPPRVFNRLRK